MGTNWDQIGWEVLENKFLGITVDRKLDPSLWQAAVQQVSTTQACRNSRIVIKTY